MHPLLAFLNAKARAEQDAFAARCRTTIGYLRKAVSVGQQLKPLTCALIEFESGGVVPVEDISLPETSWTRVPDPAWPHPAGRPLLDLARRDSGEFEAADESDIRTIEQGVA